MNIGVWDDELLGWHYEAPYDFYDIDADPPEHPERCRSLRGDDGRIEAFWELTVDGDVVEIGIGLRPDLLGRGLGERYLQAELDYAREQWRPETFRLYVTSWNERAIRLYERLGFREVGARHMRSFERFGDHEFMRMERPA